MTATATPLLTPPAAQALRALARGGQVLKAGAGTLYCVWRRDAMIGPAFPAAVRDELKAKGFIDTDNQGRLRITKVGQKAAQ
jgi:uncharacterized protein YjhX (UPF0386 family)